MEARYPVSVREIMNGRQIKGIIEGDSNPDVLIPRLVDFYLQGRFPIDRLIEFYPFAEIGEAFSDSEEGKTVKPVLRMG